MAVSSLMLCLLVPLISTLFYIVKIIQRRRSNLPPGPPPLPLIGNLHLLGPKPHKSLSKLAETYGPLMSLKLGQMTTIIVSNALVAKQVLQKQDQAFACRSIPDSIFACNHGDSSMSWIPLGAKWRLLRKISNTHIFNSKKIQDFEHIRRHKVQELIDEIHPSAVRGEAVSIGDTLFKTTLNVLSNIFLSRDLIECHGGSDDTKEFKESFMKIMELAGKANFVDFFPWLKIVDPQRIRAKMTPHFGKYISLVYSMIGERLKQRMETGSFSENKDVLDSLVNIMQEDSSEGEINRTDISHLLADLFIAGTDTTSITLEWALCEIIKNPHTMMKAKAELEQVIGKGKQAEDEDIARLPYLRAIIKETLRLHPPIPLLLPRKNVKEEELCGYTIPKDSQVMINAWAIGRDPNTWDFPPSFKPERFLESQVDFKGGNFELIPFGAGRRMCAGMPLANKMIPPILGSLLNCFDWKLEGGVNPEEELNMDDEYGLSLHLAQPLRVIPVAV